MRYVFVIVFAGNVKKSLGISRDHSSPSRKYSLKMLSCYVGRGSNRSRTGLMSTIYFADGIFSDPVANI